MKYNRDFVEIKNDRKNETGNLAVYLFTHIFLYVFILFFGIFFAWYTVFMTTHAFYAVKGPSMMPILNNQITLEQLHDYSKEGQDKLGEYCYDGVYIEYKEAEVFDIVVIDTTPKIANDSIIKRVIAKEGDYVTIAKDEDDIYRVFRIASGTNLENFTDEQAKLLENGENGYMASHLDWDEKTSEPDGDFSYESEFYNTFLDEKEADFVSNSGLKYVKVPQGKVFCLGDNRGHSSDSRERGFFAESDIVGRGKLIVYNFNFANRLWEVVKFYFSEVEKFFAR